VEIVKYIQHQCGNVKFQGVYVHCGNSYTAQTVAQVQGVRNSAMDCVLSLVASLQKEGLQCPTWGIGSTPSCSHNTDKFKKMKEIHPGNYVLYDNQQVQLGSCGDANVAGKVITRVLGHYPRRNQMLVDCGFTAFTKQGKGSQEHPQMIGRVDNHPDLMLSNMTQEIGFIDHKSKDGKIDFSLFPAGSILTLIPYHACATAACFENYYVHDDEGIIKHIWKPCKGW